MLKEYITNNGILLTMLLFNKPSIIEEIHILKKNVFIELTNNGILVVHLDKSFRDSETFNNIIIQKYENKRFLVTANASIAFSKAEIKYQIQKKTFECDRNPSFNITKYQNDLKSEITNFLVNQKISPEDFGFYNTETKQTYFSTYCLKKEILQKLYFKKQKIVCQQIYKTQYDVSNYCIIGSDYHEYVQYF